LVAERRFLLQMAGGPGAGKSTLAAEIASKRGAVIVNSDVVKSTLLDAGIAWKQAGPAAYQVLFALADDLLGQGHNVILDSPSHYDYIPENGERIAGERGAVYRFVEAVCPALDEVRRRLAERTPRRSQMIGLDTWPVDADAPTGAKRVGTHAWETKKPSHAIEVDTSGPGEDALKRALEYLDE
jgi:predicted kinase